MGHVSLMFKRIRDYIRLVRAAPLLLEACEDMLREGGADVHGFTRYISLKDNSGLVIDIARAIAKARGYERIHWSIKMLLEDLWSR